MTDSRDALAGKRLQARGFFLWLFVRHYRDDMLFIEVMNLIDRMSQGQHCCDNCARACSKNEVQATATFRHVSVDIPRTSNRARLDWSSVPGRSRQI